MRERKTSRRVVFADKASRALITVGGIGTILAVVGICVFLVYVVWPLFEGGHIEEGVRHPVAAEALESPVIRTGVDEYNLVAWALHRDGQVRLYRLDPWAPTQVERPFGEKVPSAWGFEVGKKEAVFGFEDGSIRLATIGFSSRFLPEDEDGMDATVRDLPVGRTTAYQGGVVTRTPKGQLRAQVLDFELDAPIRRDSESPVRLIDIGVAERGDLRQPVIAAMGEDGRLAVYRIRKKTNMMTGQLQVKLVPSSIPYAHPAGKALPKELIVSTHGDVVYLLWESGHLLRFCKSAVTGAWSLAEEADLVEEDEHRVTVAGCLVGKESLVVGDSSGRLRVWFRARPEDGAEAALYEDGFHMVPAHTLLEGGAAPTAIRSSARSRLLTVGLEDGGIHAMFVTNENQIAHATAGDGPIRQIAVSPKENLIVAVTPTHQETWELDQGHPEVTLRSLFGKVWYEGHSKPEHVWQSAGLTDEFEPKLGMMPLISGTLKATFYSLLFGVPIALLAALFTSEFLSPRVKVPVKSTIEVMASLPSVVLGFLAALVIAPFVQDSIAAVLVSFLTIPGAFLLGAYLWQLLPHRLTLRLGAAPRFAGLIVFLGVGVLVAGALGPHVESRLFWVADVQEVAAFHEAFDEDGEPILSAPFELTDDTLVRALRLQRERDASVLAELDERDQGRIRHLASQPLVPHRGDWRERFEEGRDFRFENLDRPDHPVLVVRNPEGRIPVLRRGQAKEHGGLFLALGRRSDIQAWLASPASGPATGGWMLLTLPFCALIAVFVLGRFGRPLMRRLAMGWTRRQSATADLVRFLGSSIVVLLLAFGMAYVLQASGFDARGGLLGTYIQRNALVVGFVMGFAIIPIIYTLAEDALSSVPSHLREGSLGAGATPWQTATRIIVPTAMSGLFSAVMIGLGRAVGETMIVLMAAGNTPILSWNPFNGFRTLSANIAVELPEAPVGESHYRTLFLNALVLFALTFIVNTFAEAVRQRFRKRAFQL